MSERPLLRAATRAAWRKWLERNHATKREIWLVFRKVATGKRQLAYADAVEEALCFGWIDTTVKSIDAQSYMQLFTPRSNTRNWSKINLDRFAEMEAAGLMTDAGRAKKPKGIKPPPARYQAGDPLPDVVADRLSKDPAAKAFFDTLAPGYRRDYVRYMTEAKKEETKQKRIDEALRLLRKGVKSIFRGV